MNGTGHRKPAETVWKRTVHGGLPRTDKKTKTRFDIDEDPPRDVPGRLRNVVALAKEMEKRVDSVRLGTAKNTYAKKTPF